MPYGQISCEANPKIQFIPKQFSQPLKIILVSIASSDDLGTFGKLGQIVFK